MKVKHKVRMKQTSVEREIRIKQVKTDNGVLNWRHTGRKLAQFIGRLSKLMC